MAKPKGENAIKRGPGRPRNPVRTRKPGAPLLHNHNLQHGEFNTRRLRQDVYLHGSRSRALNYLLDGKQPWAKALQRWRSDLVKAYGGWKMMTPLTQEILAMCTVMKVVLDSLGAYAMSHSLVDRKRKRPYPMLMALDRLMNSQTLRLERFTALMDHQRSPLRTVDDIRRSLKDETD